MANILIWSPNYAPELTGIPPLVTDLAEWLVERGHRVDVVAPVPNYPERRIREPYRGVAWMSEEINGVHVHRHWLRVRGEESFLDKALYELSSATMALPQVVPRVRRADVMLCVVPTLAAAGYASFSPSSTKLVLWVQDLVVKAAASVEAPERVRAGLGCLAMAAEKRAALRAEKLVVCSPGFADHFAAMGVARDKLEVVHNWADLDRISPSRSRAADATRFLYAGNLGYTQGFATLVGATQLSREEIEVEIVGSGNAQGQVARLASEVPNITVRPPVPREALPHLLASAHVHVVLQRAVSSGANLPSKIATYMASGKPIIASIDGGSSAATLLRESGGALLVAPDSPHALADGMDELARDAELRDVLGRKGREYATHHLSKDAALSRLERVLLG